MSETFTLEPNTIAKLEHSAQCRSISQEDALRLAVENLWNYDRWVQMKVEKSREAVARGEIFTQEEMEKDNLLLKQQIMERF